MGAVRSALRSAVSPPLASSLGATPFSLSDLFTGQAGAALDFSALINYQTNAGSTPADAVDDTIGYATDLSGNDDNFTQATATARPLLKQDGSSRWYAEFDLGDDKLTATLPAITGQIAIATSNGLWIEDITFAGGTFDIGPTTYTGGPAGLLTALANGGTELNVYGAVIREGSFTTAEQNQLLSHWAGCPGIITLGPELVTNGTFDSDVSGWTSDSTISHDTTIFTNGGIKLDGQYNAMHPLELDTSKRYIARCDFNRDTATRALLGWSDDDSPTVVDIFIQDTVNISGSLAIAFRPFGIGENGYLKMKNNPVPTDAIGYYDNISAKEIIFP